MRHRRRTVAARANVAILPLLCTASVTKAPGQQPPANRVLNALPILLQSLEFEVLVLSIRTAMLCTTTGPVLFAYGAERSEPRFHIGQVEG